MKDTKKTLFNMRGLIQSQFNINLVKNVYHINFDTYENENLFFSHRRSTHDETLPTGRMINIIGFKNNI
jgi:copper oxidase (laccase) domain-containing protein